MKRAHRRSRSARLLLATLLKAAEDWGRKKGAEFASLEFHNENKRAGLFYQKMGYRPASITAIKRL